MKKENTNYLLVGGFSLAMFALLIVVMLRLTGQNSGADEYYSMYDNVTGIKVGSAVSYGGYRIGEVHAVEPVRRGGKTFFKLTLAIEKGWKVPENSLARIISPGVLSDKQVNIEEGNSNKFLKPGNEIKGRAEANIMSILNSVAAEVHDVSVESIKPFMNILRKHVDSIGGSLSQRLPELANSAQAVLENLNQRITAIKRILNDGNVEKVNRIIGNVETFSSGLKKMSGDFSKLSNELGDLLKNSSSIVSENRTDVKKAIIDMRKVMNAASRSISSIVYNLEGASRNMNEFSRQISENPGLLLGGASQSDKVKEATK